MDRAIFQVERYPTTPGCYLMRDVRGAVLYVGKAKNLRRRLSSHLRSRHLTSERSQLRTAVAEIEVILTRNEVEALVLEHNLIKRHRPRFNRAMVREEEGYFYIALTDEDLPRLVPYRKGRANKVMERGGPTVGIARLFGPYVSRRFRDTLLTFATDHFGLRTCTPLPAHVCLRYHLGHCGGICKQLVSVTDYAAAVRRATTLLGQGNAQVLRQLRRQLTCLAGALEFERAAHLKRRLEMLESALEPQAVERERRYDQDVLFFGKEHALIMQIRHGRVETLSVEAFTVSEPRAIETSRLASSGSRRRGSAVQVPPDGSTLLNDQCDRFLLARYRGAGPRELIVNHVGNRQALEKMLSAARGYPVRVRAAPLGDDQRELMDLYALNYMDRVGAAEGGPESMTTGDGKTVRAS